MHPLLTIHERHQVPEWMDSPDLDADLHRAALRGLGRINKISRVARLLWGQIEKLAGPGQPLTVLDVGSGGGDTAIALGRLAEQSGRQVSVEGMDVSPLAVEFANQAAREWGVSNVRFQQGNILADALPDRYDVVTCSLFLHHFADDEARQVLTAMREAAQRAVLVDDLCRSRLGYSLAWIGCRIFSRSPVVHYDGPASVAGAYTPEEARQLAEASGMADVSIRRHWPQRFLMTWRRP